MLVASLFVRTQRYPVSQYRDSISALRPLTLFLMMAFALMAGALSINVHGATSPLAANLAPATLANAEAEDQLSGYLEAMVNEERVLLPALKVDYEVDVFGDLAQVTVVQTFSNPLTVAITPRYLFPLHEEAAVSALTMRVGDEVVQGVFQRKAKAEQTFKKAQAAGKVASLVKQQRPNMFTQRIANLMPGAQVRVELAYTQRLRKQDGEYELVLPLVVGPRFDPAGGSASDPTAAQQPATNLNAPVPYAPVTGLDLPAAFSSERVGLRMNLEAPVPVLAVASRTHGLNVQRQSEQQLRVGFARDRVLDNRDFVLRYQLGAEAVSAGLLSHWDGPLDPDAPEQPGGGYFSLLIEPPTDLQPDALLPREMVFLLDCSGSMNGLPMAASKAFMRAALEGLRPSDQFRIIRFSDRANEFSDAPLAATDANIAAGLAYTEQLRGMGGTVMSSGIYKALSEPADAGVVRTVVFLTDGYIGNEAEVLKLVQTELGAARLYALGVGSGVNRYLLEELAKVGRGFVRYMDPTESVDEVAQELAARLSEPVLTDLAIDWGDLPVTDVAPAQLPDLFAGDSLRVQGRFATPVTGQIVLKGQSSAGALRKPLWVALDGNEQRLPVRQIWARQQVADYMQSLITPVPYRAEKNSDAELRESVTRLGETYGLLTRWTALVAVSQQVYQTNPQDTRKTSVPVPMVAGVNQNAYGGQQQAWPAFSGAGTPEPAVWAGLLLLGLLGWLSRGQLLATQASAQKNRQI